MNRTINDHMADALESDRWIVIEHDRDSQVCFADLTGVFGDDSRWVRWEEDETPAIFRREDVKRELTEASAIQLRIEPPFYPPEVAV